MEDAPILEVLWDVIGTLDKSSFGIVQVYSDNTYKLFPVAGPYRAPDVLIHAHHHQTHEDDMFEILRVPFCGAEAGRLGPLHQILEFT